jgi:hypothetical protein
MEITAEFYKVLGGYVFGPRRDKEVTKCKKFAYLGYA